MINSTDYSATGTMSLKPGYVSSLSNAAKQFKVFWTSLLVVTVVYFVIGAVLGFTASIPTFSPNYTYQSPGSNFWLLLAVFEVVYITISYGYALATLKAARGEKPAIRDLFWPYKRFFTVIFSMILLTIIIGFGFVLLIIPGVIFMVRLFFVPYLIVDKKAGVFGAIGGSWRMTKGHFWKIFLLGLTFIAFSLVLAVILILIGITADAGGTKLNMWIYLYGVLFIPIEIYVMLAMGSLYHAIRLEKEKVVLGTTLA